MLYTIKVLDMHVELAELVEFSWTSMQLYGHYPLEYAEVSPNIRFQET